MIHANRIVTVGEQESIIDRPIILYRGDREVEIEFTLVGNEFTFSEEGNVIKSVNASHGQLVLNTPSGEHMFSELAECHEGKVVFVVTKEMIDEFVEMGFYSFQIRLYDSAEMKSRVTIPPVMNGFDIRNPIAAEDEVNIVDQGLVDYARVFKDQSNEELHTFDWTGAYNKTEWTHHDVITENKMNKIEDALYSINATTKELGVDIPKTLDQVKKDADKYVKEHIAEVEADVEEFERNLNTDVQKFKIDTNAAMTTHKNEVSEELVQKTNKDELPFVNVKWFGAKGDGLTDDSSAIQSAINYVLSVNPNNTKYYSQIFFPPGEYCIESDNIFSDINLDGITKVIKGGLKFYGTHYMSSVLKLVTNGTEKWFYNNQRINNQMFNHISFDNLSFVTDDTTLGNGFKFFSQGGEKQFKYTYCVFNLGIIHHYNGIGNADLNRFDKCNLTSRIATFHFNNNQSVSNELYNSNCTVYGDFIQLGEGGGGAFNMFGGNLEMHNEDGIDDALNYPPNYLFVQEVDSTNAAGNCNFSFIGVRYEIHGTNKILVKTYNSHKLLNINFDKCQFGTVRGGDRIAIDITPTKSVTFRDCTLNSNFLYKVSGTYASSSGSPSFAQLKFFNCDLGSTSTILWDKIIKEDNCYRIVARNCYNGVGGSDRFPYCLDLDYGWQFGVPKGFSADKKVVPIKWEGIGMPWNGHLQVRIPPDSFITKIYFKKPKIATANVDFRIIISNEDKSIILHDSGIIRSIDEHIINIDNYGFYGESGIYLYTESELTGAFKNELMGYIEYI